MAIIYRLEKGSKLTKAELDNNFAHLDNIKLNKDALSLNNTMLIRDNEGNIVSIEVGGLTLVGRLASGEIKALSVSEIKALLSLDIPDIDGLQDELDVIIDDIETLQTEKADAADVASDIAALAGAIASKADASALAGKQDTIAPSSGWSAPSGLSSKGTFDTVSVTLPELAQRMKALIDALTTQGLLTP